MLGNDPILQRTCTTTRAYGGKGACFPLKHVTHFFLYSKHDDEDEQFSPFLIADFLLGNEMMMNIASTYLFKRGYFVLHCMSECIPPVSFSLCSSFSFCTLTYML